MAKVAAGLVNGKTYSGAQGSGSAPYTAIVSSAESRSLRPVDRHRAD